MEKIFIGVNVIDGAIFGVSYNVFNGEEFLRASLMQIRDSVDHINIVVQYVSNTGAHASPGLPDLMASLVADGLVDSVIDYLPDLSLKASENEIRKRQKGLDVAVQAGVNYFMTMDCDEFYLKTELELAKKFILENNIRASAVPSYLHIKRPVWRSKSPDSTYVSFFSKVDLKTKLIYKSSYPVLVDPTRRINGDVGVYVFDEAVISMRHMNLVRHDFSSKLKSSSSHSNKRFIKRVSRVYEDWSFGKLLKFPGKMPIEIIEVPDYFGIDKDFSYMLQEVRQSTSLCSRISDVIKRYVRRL